MDKEICKIDLGSGEVVGTLCMSAWEHTVAEQKLLSIVTEQCTSNVNHRSAADVIFVEVQCDKVTVSKKLS